MYTMNELINEIESLKGANVNIFGQSVTLNKEVDNITIDIIPILKALKDYEVTEYEVYYYNPNTEEEGYADILEDCKDSDDAFNALRDNGIIHSTEYGANNSYNWNAPINHHFNYQIFKGDDGTMFIFFKVHRYGDVRCNYTEEVVLHFTNESEFFQLLLEYGSNISTITVDGVDDYYCEFNVLAEGYEITTLMGEHICTAYGDAEDIIYCIRENV